MVVEISLTQGKVALVDDADAELISQYKWCVMKSDRTYYAKRAHRNNGKCITVLMHTVLTGCKKVDHINGDGLDNRRENLRRATTRENNQNRRKRLNASSRFNGVYYSKKSRKFQAQIRVPAKEGGQGKQIYLGLFEDEVQAAKAYDNEARKIHGEYAALNFPQPGEQSAIERRKYE